MLILSSTTSITTTSSKVTCEAWCSQLVKLKIEEEEEEEEEEDKKEKEDLAQLIKEDQEARHQLWNCWKIKDCKFEKEQKDYLKIIMIVLYHWYYYQQQHHWHHHQMIRKKKTVLDNIGTQIVKLDASYRRNNQIWSLTK